MARKIIWTKRANKRLNQIINYLEGEFGETITKNFVSNTYQILDLISQNPNLGTMENLDKSIRGFLLTKHNRVFYRVTEREIIILNFFDTRSNPKNPRY
jgi:plasmid stabilization system protein ParE